MGCLLIDFEANFGKLAAAFALLAIAACLSVHLAKVQLCVVINNRRVDISAVLRRAGGDRIHTKLVDYLKYIGVFLDFVLLALCGMRPWLAFKVLPNPPRRWSMPPLLP